jgi:hypothetical protein
LVERWFGELTTKKIKRGPHCSVPELERDMTDGVKTWNENPHTSGSRRRIRFGRVQSSPYFVA